MSATIQSDVAPAIANVRNDSSAQDWVLVGYEGNETIKLLGTGTGGIEELKSCLIEDVCYGLVRKEHMWETAGQVSAKTIKHVWVCYRPEGISVARKMKIGIFEGQIKRLFQPYHADLCISTLSEIGEGALKDLLDSITMRANKTGDASAANSSPPPVRSGVIAGGASSRGSLTQATVGGVSATSPRGSITQMGSSTSSLGGHYAGAASPSQGVGPKQGTSAGAAFDFEDPEDFKSAIMAVRNDQSAEDWCLIGFKDKRSLKVLARGSGGIDEMLKATQESAVNYGMFRVTDRRDPSTINVIFCFLTWQPEVVPPMDKARASTQRGGICNAFREIQPFHFEFRATTRAELNSQMVQDHIGRYTGTKDNTGPPK